MTTSIWRYSHLTLAISSFLFLLVASLTGIILAFEPISKQLSDYNISNTKEITLAQTISVLQKQYDEVISITIDENDFVSASVVTKEGKSDTFYVNPNTGEKLGDIEKKKPIFQFATSLHRSLFLKSTGRFIVSFISFLLCLIAITGLILITKRQGGFKKLFSKIVKENFEQYYHIIIGRYTLIPIIIITLTGVYLSLDRFSVLPVEKINHSYDFSLASSKEKITLLEFPVFKNTTLNEVKSVEFPFSEDEEDYFFVKLTDSELIIHQYTGTIISKENLSLTSILLNWSLLLHTGNGTIVWSIILLLSSISILFFIYSGFAMTFSRTQKRSLPKNKTKKDNAEIIILVGSETNNTYPFASSLHNALIKKSIPVFIDILNNYTSYKNAKHLIILTSTYGEGEAPSNASKFLQLFQQTAIQNKINYSIVGFGSRAYPHFCQFAIDINSKLQQLPEFTPLLPVYKINNQSFQDFKTWGHLWSKKTNIQFELTQEVKKHKKQQTFTTVSKTDLNNDDSFLIRLQPTKKLRFNSGDLLAITPKEDNIERLYSVGKIDNDIILSIKKHDLGVCSNLLYQLEENEIIQASIQQNKDFYFPRKKKEVVLIANGTGIAPFLGMLQHKNGTKAHLFWGGRTKESLRMYAPLLKNIEKNNIHIAYSQEKEKEYVQDLLLKKETTITTVLKNGGTIMICGSIKMLKGVEKVLEQITSTKLNTSLDYFKKKNQIKTDCY
ncbi:sulfite reductase (NADPH) flavoprotein alpha-component [Tenacibaculum mesophilum]|uniref:PepSY domain-containing protein n=1 Tax=Tenacibaculum mesophilum TaxID=104268 RepID=UPI00091C4BED|nr:PepSY domain-containing protein [Tenacibaculum mesophilum]SHF49138.1 sulfite reductase (NADPH) flavoprotein alpha-component [Tenacibaculum mesophilum]